jgi:hypothetical protein
MAVPMNTDTTTPDLNPAGVEPQPCVIDIEASGFGRHSYPIEVGYVLPDGVAHCTLIQPAPGWTHWDDQAADVHQIERQLLLQHGRPAAEVARQLNLHLAGMTVYCDGWAHDYNWLAKLFDAADLVPWFKLESVGRLLTESRLARLPEARGAALRDMGLQRHRASNDARALQRAIFSVA